MKTNADIINEIASKLGVTVEYIIPELAKYNIAQGLFMCIVTTIILIISIMLIVHCYKKDDGESVCVLTCIIIIVSIILLGVGYDLVGWIVSPTGRSIAYILNKI